MTTAPKAPSKDTASKIISKQAKPEAPKKKVTPPPLPKPASKMTLFSVPPPQYTGPGEKPPKAAKAPVMQTIAEQDSEDSSSSFEEVDAK